MQTFDMFDALIKYTPTFLEHDATLVFIWLGNNCYGCENLRVISYRIIRCLHHSKIRSLYIIL